MLDLPDNEHYECSEEDEFLCEEFNYGPYDDDFGDDFESLEYNIDECSANASSNWQNFHNF